MIAIFLLIFVVVIVLITVIIVTYALLDHYLCVIPRLMNIKKHESLNSNKQSSNLKQGFSAGKINEAGEFDVIIIGSGIGSLTTAALLSRRGWKVLCLEQHDTAGGCLHTFEDNGVEFDTGLHYIGANVGSKKSLTGFIFDLLTMGRVRWQKMDQKFDVAMISETMNPSLSTPTSTSTATSSTPRECHIGGDMSSLENEFITQYPKDATGIKQYFNLLRWSDLVFPVLLMLKLLPLQIATTLRRRLLDPYLLSPFTSTSTRDIFQACNLDTNPSLCGSLGWCWGDYGLPPSKSSFLMHAVLSNHFISGDAYYPKGGPSAITAALISLIEGTGTGTSKGTGSKVFVRAPVSKILFEGNRAIGVNVRGIDIFCKRGVISGVGVLNTYTKLIEANDVSRKLQTLEPSCAMFSVCITLAGGPSELRIPAKNYWLFPSWDHDKSWNRYCETVHAVHAYNEESGEGSSGSKGSDSFDSSKAAGYDFPCIFISSSSAKDPTWEERFPGKSVVEILTVADYAAFTKLEDKKASSSKPGHRGIRYECAKKHIEERMLEAFRGIFPHLGDKVLSVSSGSPLTNNFYLGALQGEVYGLAHTCQRFSVDYEWLLRPRQTSFQGLYLTGQDIVCDGVCGALAAGVLTAITLDRTVLIDLVTSYITEYI